MVWNFLFGRKEPTKKEEFLLNALRKISSQNFYRADRMVELISDKIEQQVHRKKTAKYIGLALSLKGHLGKDLRQLRRLKLSEEEKKALLDILNEMGISDYGYPVPALLLEQEQLTPALLSMVHNGEYAYIGNAKDANKDFFGVWELFFESVEAKADRANGLLIEKRLLTIIPAGRNKKGSYKSKTNDNYVVEVFRDEVSNNLTVRAGHLLNAYPEYISVLSPNDFYVNRELADLVFDDIFNSSTFTLSSIQDGRDNPELRERYGLEVLRFAANTDGIVGSYQESSRSVDRFYGRKLTIHSGGTPLNANDIGFGVKLTGDLERKISRNLSGFESDAIFSK